MNTLVFLLLSTSYSSVGAFIQNHNGNYKRCKSDGVLQRNNIISNKLNINININININSMNGTPRSSIFKLMDSSSNTRAGTAEETAATSLLSLLDEIKQMRVREIKKELDEAGISTSDCFEKEELVQRLYNYKKEKKNDDDDDENINKDRSRGRPNYDKDSSSTTSNSNTRSSTQGSSTQGSTTGIIRVPMEFHSLSSKSVPSKNNVFLRPSPGKFPAITVTLPTKKNKKLTLLVDTACSGLIIRPNVVKTLQLPTINAGVTLTAAGGSMNGSSNNSVCSLDYLKLMDENESILKDFIVLSQDIGSLPPILDGIVGLSFLERYHSVSFDFDNGVLVLNENNTTSNNNSDNNKKEQQTMLEYLNPMQYEILAETKLQRSRLGIYIAQTTLDGRGPVKMIVDSGAAATFLNWKGVADLNMDRSHPLISYNSEAIGVMGADNNALSLSHRFVLKRRVNFASSQQSQGINSNLGMFAPGLEIENDDDAGAGAGSGGAAMDSAVNVDIGDLPVLQQMRTEDVGGILGNDILMRCDVVHFDNLKDLSSLKLSLLRRRKDGEMHY